MLLVTEKIPGMASGDKETTMPDYRNLPADDFVDRVFLPVVASYDLTPVVMPGWRRHPL
jgi:hypothetical protein